MHLMGFVWWIYGNYVLINAQDCRVAYPSLFWLTFADGLYASLFSLVLLTYIIFVFPFLVVLLVVVLCSSRIVARSEALSMAGLSVAINE